MYNGIGLGTARGSGTNGYVQRNISAIRKTKEKIPDYHEKEDNAVRPFDPELVEHERRRQAEVRCMELRDLLEEQDLPEAEIEKKVNDFRNKLLAEKKLTYQRDSSGRAIVKDSHEFSVAQEQKNTRAKDAFGIREDFIPGQSMEGKGKFGENKELQEKAEMEAAIPFPSIAKEKSPEKEKEKAKKRKKSHKRSRRSSSSSDSSSDEESRRKKRKKEKKKKSKKSHRHRKDSSSKKSHKTSENKESDHEEVDGNRNITKPISQTPSTCCISIATSGSSSSDESNHSQDKNGNSKYSLSIVDFTGHHKHYPSLPTKIKKSNGKLSPVEAFQRACIPLLASVVEPSACPSHRVNGSPAIMNHNQSHPHHSDRSRSGSSNSSRSESRSITRVSKSRSVSRSRSRSHSRRRSLSSRSRSKSFEKASSKSRSRSRSKSQSRSRSRSHSKSSSRSSRSRSSKHSSSSRSRSNSPTESVHSAKSGRSRSPSIPRRRGSSPSFMDRRRITSSRKRPIPYKRKDAVEWNVSSSDSDD